MKWISFFLGMSALFLNTAFGVYKSNMVQNHNNSSDFYETQNLSLSERRLSAELCDDSQLELSFVQKVIQVAYPETSFSFTPAPVQIAENNQTLIEIEIVYHNSTPKVEALPTEGIPAEQRLAEVLPAEVQLAESASTADLPGETPLLLPKTLEVLGIMAPGQIGTALRSVSMCLEPSFCFDLNCHNPGAVILAFHQGEVESTGITYLD